MGYLNNRRRGAGVYGSYDYSIRSNYVDTTYAGFFYGRTKVRGNLIVTGKIQGTLLSNTVSSSNLRSSAFSSWNENQLSNKLRPLKAISFTFDSSQSVLFKSSTSEDMANIDASIEEEEVSDIERQIFSKQHFGLDADQLEEVFPDLVYEQEDGTKSINYVEMVPILVQAINELSAKVASLEGNKDGSVRMTKQLVTGTDEIDENIIALSLGQNKPNPFSNRTTIEVCIPDDVQNAFIYVYDLQGKKVEQVDITARGKQNVHLTSANLTDGMYLYSLIADGKVVETRRMIVEK